MAQPCNTNYYDYISECADYDQITSDAITSSTTSTTTTSTEAADEEASFWQWFGPVLGVITVAGIGVTVRYAQRIGQGVVNLSRLVTGLLGRRRQERDIEAQPRPWLALPTVTPPPAYDSVVEGSDNRYEDHELDSNQDSFPIRIPIRILSHWNLFLKLQRHQHHPQADIWQIVPFTMVELRQKSVLRSVK